MPWAIATAAIDIPGCAQAATASALNSSLWRRRRRPPSKAAGIVFTNPPRVEWIRDSYTPCRNSRWEDWTLTKVLVHDGIGVWLAARRLNSGRFVWPRDGAGKLTLTREQFDMLVLGLPWQRIGEAAIITVL